VGDRCLLQQVFLARVDHRSLPVLSCERADARDVLPDRDVDELCAALLQRDAHVLSDKAMLLGHQRYGGLALMSHTKTAGSQFPSYPTERLTHSLAGPRADISQQVAS
jgi:hypothetical protein